MAFASRTITLEVHDPDDHIRRKVVDTVWDTPAEIVDDSTELVYWIVRKSDKHTPEVLEKEIPGEGVKARELRESHKH